MACVCVRTVPCGVGACACVRACARACFPTVSEVSFFLASLSSPPLTLAPPPPPPLPDSCVVGSYGGAPIGSLKGAPSAKGAASEELLPSALPALLFDCTHDNPTPAQKRHPADALSSAALVSAAVRP
jgi:hypothetical protein